MNRIKNLDGGQNRDGYLAKRKQLIFGISPKEIENCARCDKKKILNQLYSSLEMINFSEK
jgi:hypothetical protein